jgi:hypothetical protein
LLKKNRNQLILKRKNFIELLAINIQREIIMLADDSKEKTSNDKIIIIIKRKQVNLYLTQEL